MLQYHVIFTGHVQGVGFRYTAQSIAERLGLTGWVRNLDDGSVELMAEGDEAGLEDLVRQLKHEFSIDRAHVQTRPAAGIYKSFNITL